MRFLTIMLLLFVTSYAFARDFDLTSKEINLGELAQVGPNPAHETLNVIRGVDTPDKVVLSYSLKTLQTICTRYETVPVWVPAPVVCQTINNQQVCYPSGSGHYEYQQVCVASDRVLVSDGKKLYLDFSKISKLDGNSREVFALEFNQRTINQYKHDISVLKVEGSKDYDVKESTILGLKRTFKFEER